MTKKPVSILPLSNTQAKELAGRFVSIGGAGYYFKDYDKDQPGQPPWRSGAEGKAFPLLRRDGSAAAYLKFFTEPTPKRLNRTAWLIGQHLNTWLPQLSAAPLLWTDTRRAVQGARIDFHFAAYLAKAVPGETWMEAKSGIASGVTRFPDDVRWRCVNDLLSALSVLERADLVHGDLSPNNIIIDLAATPDAPMLYLIDFDAFVAPNNEPDRILSMAEGGTYGTSGYCPPDLLEAASVPGSFVAPYSDRYGRDMLLLELLVMGTGLPSDDPIAEWEREQLQRHFAAWRARSDAKHVQALSYLDPATVFQFSETQRPAAVDLATGLGLSLPERRTLCRVVALPKPVPALLGRKGTDKKRGEVPSEAFEPEEIMARLGSHPGGMDDSDLKLFVAAYVFLAVLLLILAILLSAGVITVPTEPNNEGHFWDTSLPASASADFS